MNKNRQTLGVLVIGVIMILALFLRWLNLSKAPIGMYIDEIEMGYQARSLIETGKDYRGENKIAYIRSFNADRTPIPVWFTVLSTKLFSDPFYQVRGGAVIAGMMALIVFGFWMWEMTKSREYVYLGMFLMAVSMWMINFSRIAFEGMSVLMVLGLVGVSALRWIETRERKWLLWFGFLLGVSFYTYRTMTLLAPLFFLWVLVSEFFTRSKGKIRFDLLGWGLSFVIMGAVSLPFVWGTVLFPNDQLRISQISIFSDKEVPIKVVRNRELASGDMENPEIGSQAVWWSKVVFNKPVSFGKTFVGNYLKAFSLEFLFISGDPNLRHNTPNSGVFYVIDILALIAGFYVLWLGRKQQKYLILGGWLFLAPLGSVITENGGVHAHRLLVFGWCLLSVLTLGWGEILKRFKFMIPVWVLIYLGFVGFYMVKYQINYVYESARWFGAGYREVMLEIGRIEDQFVRVEMAQDPEPPIFYYLFWNNVPPAEVIAHGTDFSNKDYGDRLDKYKTLDLRDGEKLSVKNMKKDTLYMVTQNQLPVDLRTNPPPVGMKLWKVILYPDNNPAFYLVSLGS